MACCIASQNGSIPHINLSIEVASKSCLQMLLVAVLLFLLSKSKNGGAIRKKKSYLWTVMVRFLFYPRTVRKLTCFGSATEMKSDRSEFIFRSVNAWKEIDFWFWFHFSLWRSTLTIHFLFCVLTFGAWPLSAALADMWWEKRRMPWVLPWKNWNCLV